LAALATLSLAMAVDGAPRRLTTKASKGCGTEGLSDLDRCRGLCGFAARVA